MVGIGRHRAGIGGDWAQTMDVDAPSIYTNTNIGIRTWTRGHTEIGTTSRTKQRGGINSAPRYSHTDPVPLGGSGQGRGETTDSY